MIKTYVILISLALCLLFFSSIQGNAPPKVRVGSEQLVTASLRGKRVGLITNHTAINSQMQSTIDILKQQAPLHKYVLAALFAPEHGIRGAVYAGEEVKEEVDPDGIPIFSLHGKTRRPTAEMLKKIDLLIYDIQDIGVRSYTYATTLFYAMEEAAKRGIPVMVLDRPNPINGLIVDGPMLEEKWRSFLGYINVPYCHGMTIGELAAFFNAEYQVGCQLQVVPMKGWFRSMSFNDTGLTWIPTSPNIPEATTPFFYPTTGLLGELSLINIGIGYTLPFKIVGAPWIQAPVLAKALNDQHLGGVYFEPFCYRPFYGKFAQENCEGVLIVITDPREYKPVATQYLILGLLKSLYPKEFKEILVGAQKNRELFCKVCGTEEIFRLMNDAPYLVWPLKQVHQNERNAFLKIRQKYLIKEYGV